ncbi:MAG TPA: hypothetical protein IAB38_00220 [Candidatus Onthousia excrementipullorum]|uniref:Uncharacterized protein n=1 Tax=Candidatus Onthousia excrementipullorum TaxID=2840884 RepID=A0A9D1DSV2_9FIRM|nr:hypothetical protein [Candidatus Onthousia excrementipullorum]
MGRMERYDSSNRNTVRSRTEKNKDLYNDLGRLEKYTTLTDVSKIDAVELSSAKKNYRTREGYHSLKDYDMNIEEKPKERKELDEFNFLYNNEHKTYDINKVLEEAKELREKDALEKKRKLHNEKYNILESSEEDLEKFKEETKLRHKPIENEEELEELIHTITSKELREEIDKAESNDNNSLLSDLMATNVNEEVLKPIATKIEDSKVEDDTKKLDKVKEKTMSLKDEIDKSFYTKSLDLSEEDFESDDEEEVKPSKFIGFLKFLFSLILILAVGFGVYYVITNF